MTVQRISPNSARVVSRWALRTGIMWADQLCFQGRITDRSQYLLDNDVEHFNEAEPITTKCPLLPGQPVNVLNVPIILPDSCSHGRSSSTGSQEEDYRTMNPEDKFMNPRKPPKPSSNRVQTSAVHLQPTAGSSSSTSPISGMIHRSASQPNSAKYRMHSPKDARSISPPGSRSFRAAFRSPNDTDGQKWHQALSRSKTHAGTPRKERFFEEHHNISKPILNAFPMPTSGGDASASTIQSRRALKGNGGAASTRNLLTVETQPKVRQPSPSNSGAPSKNLVTIDESQVIKDAVSTTGSGSAGMTTPTGPDLHEKRLPSLPNTPSSVMDEAVRAIDEKDKAMDADVLRSHFSSLTTTTADDTHSRFVPERSHFSEWSMDTAAEDAASESRISASTFNNGNSNESPALEEWRTPDLSQGTDASNTDPNTPHLTVHSKPSSPNSAAGDIPPWNMNMSLPQLTVSLSSPHGSGLGIEQMDEVESNPKRHAALFSALESMGSLSRAHSPDGSPLLFPPMRGSDNERGETDTRFPDTRSRNSNASFRGKATMQEMLDELSYLKNMIQAEMDGEPF